MKKFRKVGLLLMWFGFILGNIRLGAEEALAPPVPSLSRKPIVTKWGTLGGMKYYQSGKEIKEYKELKGIIFPLNDSETTGLLKKSENDNTVGTIFGVGGLGLEIGGIIGAASTYNSSQGNYRIDAGMLVLACAGFVLDIAGGFILIESNTTKFTAVQRYNQVVRNEADLSMNGIQLPSTPGLAISMNF